MKEKIEEVIRKVESTDSISNETKPFILEKLEEWKAEKNAINDVSSRFEAWWLEVEPIFAELGWV